MARMRITKRFEGDETMNENKLLLSEFASEDGFELSSYINQLFEYFSSLSKNQNTNTEPTP
ncbi:hypothetical protein QE429_000562 [Bacillus sp. SORGH_AS 510]|nr:hypothetical protein [Bacillus sp. SORGH_AS_0510]